MIDDELIFGSDFFDLEEELAPTSDKLHLREGELREVTVLFADIHGFSSISNLFDAETIHRRMDEIMKIFSRCISFYGGFVDKYMGDGIMALFGAKTATEQNTERAILAALKMQEQLQLYNKKLKQQPDFENVDLGVRIGINAGLVSVGKVGEDREGDFTVYGPEVNLASRMESNAPVNRIMLPEKTMLAVQRNFEFEDVGLKSVKGFSEPLPCYLVIGPKLDSSLHRRNLSTRYIGRIKEIDLLKETFSEIGKQQQISVVAIQGEAGIGKTRLVYEFERTCADNTIFLQGACSAISPTPLNLFTSLCETLFRLQINEKPEVKRKKLDNAYNILWDIASEEEKELLSDGKNLIAFLLELKSEDSRLKQSGADLLQHLSLAIENLIMAQINYALRSNRKLVIVLDDLHWLDEASAKVMENLLNKIASAGALPPLMLILMFRPGYNLASYFQVLTQVKIIELNPLAAEEIRELIAAQAKDKHLLEDTVDKVIQLSQGNPFFVEEWCNYIEDLPLDELKDIPVPANLYNLILSRLDKLPVSLRMMLHKAAVIGQEFFVEILRYMEKRLQDNLDVDATLKSLEDQSYILHSLGFDYSTYFFKHILTREVAYQTLLAENRKVLHRLCGEAIETLYPDRLDEFYYALAEHFHKAEVIDKAIIYIEKAANSAAKVYNNQQALRFYQLLLDYPDLQPVKRLEITMQIADIMWLTGDWNNALKIVYDLLHEAQKINAEKVCFEAYRFLGIAAFYQNEKDEALSYFKLAYDLAKKLNDPALISIAVGNLGNWYFRTGDLTLASHLQQQDLSISIDRQDSKRQAKAYSNLGLICLEEDDLEKAEDYFYKSLKIAVDNRFLKEQSIALGNLGYTKMLAENYAEAFPLLQQKLKIATEMNDKLELINVLGNIAIYYMEIGERNMAMENYHKIVDIYHYLGDENGEQEIRDYIALLNSELK